jgi:NAD(P)-dependent dehydrogenase (short-subunit alcohol dehydrogenase family)
MAQRGWIRKVSEFFNLNATDTVASKSSRHSRAAGEVDVAAQGVAEEVRACGRRAILVQADVGQIGQVQAMASAAQEGLGPIDVLINNAEA